MFSGNTIWFPNTPSKNEAWISKWVYLEFFGNIICGDEDLDFLGLANTGSETLLNNIFSLRAIKAVSDSDVSIYSIIDWFSTSSLILEILYKSFIFSYNLQLSAEKLGSSFFINPLINSFQVNSFVLSLSKIKGLS